MNESQFERLVVAFESIAKSLERWREANYPEKRPASDATVTRIPTEEDIARENQGYAPGEDLQEWLGRREREFLELEEEELTNDGNDAAAGKPEPAADDSGDSEKGKG